MFLFCFIFNRFHFGMIIIESEEEQQIMSPFPHHVFSLVILIHSFFFYHYFIFIFTIIFRYGIKLEDFLANHGEWLTRRYGSAVCSIVMETYSDISYKPWLFAKSPKGFFKDIKNRIEYLNWLKEEVKAANLKELTVSDLYAHGGSGLLKMYKTSLSKILESINSDSSGKTRRKTVSWTMEKQRELLDQIGAKLGIGKENFGDWYKVQKKQIRNLGGAGLLSSRYTGSLSRMLLKVYPEYDWVPWKFSVLPRAVRKDSNLLKRALKEIENAFGIKEIDEL